MRNQDHRSRGRIFPPNESLPEIITYIEDIDLWNLKYEEVSKQVCNYLSMFRNEPEAMLELMEGDIDIVMEKGAVITQYADGEIKRMVDIPCIYLHIGEHVVPAYNITMHQSASGNILSKEKDSVVTMFTIKGDKVTFSFRSLDNQQPTSLELAEILGGGGHKNSSGARVTLTEFLDMIKR